MDTNIENQYNRFNNFENNSELEKLLELYRVIIQGKNNTINIKTYIAKIENFFGNKISCGTCPSTIKKAQSDFEKVVFTKLYREFPYMIYKPLKSNLENTRFVNGMYETLVTSSFSIFNDLMASFGRDFSSRRLSVPREKFNTANEELIKFNTLRYRYFDKFEQDGVTPTIYSDYLHYKELYELSKENAKNTKLPTEELIEEVKEKVDVSKLEIKDKRIKTEGKYKTQRKVDLEVALELKKEGKNNVEIAQHFGVSKQAIGKLFNNNVE
jgi:hypothetical protein